MDMDILNELTSAFFGLLFGAGGIKLLDRWLNRRKHKSDTTMSEVQNIEQIITSFQGTIKSLTDQVKDLVIKNLEILNQINDLKVENHKLLGKNSDVLVEIKQLRGKNKELLDKNTAILLQLKTVRAENVRLSNKLTDKDT